MFTSSGTFQAVTALRTPGLVVVVVGLSSFELSVLRTDDDNVSPTCLVIHLAVVVLIAVYLTESL